LAAVRCDWNAAEEGGLVVIRRPTRCFRVRRGRVRPCEGRQFVPDDGDGRYILGVDQVIDEGRDLAEVADELNIVPSLLAIWVENTRTNLEFLAEIEAEEAADD
jgi:hypothetical protein